MRALEQHEVGQILVQLRQSHHLSIERVGDHLGVDAEEVELIEAGEAPLTGGDMVRLANLFGVPVSTFNEKVFALFRADTTMSPAASQAVRTALRYVDFHRGVRALAS